MVRKVIFSHDIRKKMNTASTEPRTKEHKKSKLVCRSHIRSVEDEGLGQGKEEHISTSYGNPSLGTQFLIVAAWKKTDGDFVPFLLSATGTGSLPQFFVQQIP